jgi:hypothetical protein
VSSSLNIGLGVNTPERVDDNMLDALSSRGIADRSQMRTPSCSPRLSSQWQTIGGEVFKKALDAVTNS